MDADCDHRFNVHELFAYWDGRLPVEAGRTLLAQFRRACDDCRTNHLPGFRAWYDQIRSSTPVLAIDIEDYIPGGDQVARTRTDYTEPDWGPGGSDSWMRHLVSALTVRPHGDMTPEMEAPDRDYTEPLPATA